MKRSHKAAGILAALSLGLASTVLAHQGQMQGQMQGPGQMGNGMGNGMGHGMKGGMGMHGKSGMGQHGAGQELMTSEERSALMEKMRSAKTPEERQQLAEANRAEMQKRAKEKGIELHGHRGPGAGAQEHKH